MGLRGKGAVIMLLSLTMVAWACAQEQKAATEDAAQAATAGKLPEGKVEATPKEAEPDAKKPAEGHMVRMTTSMGVIDIELYPKEAPITVESILSYVNKGFYDGTIFHRVIPGFVIQGGGFTADMTQKTTEAPIKNEATNGLQNKRGTLSMARTNVIDSATSQFFINLKDNASLDHVPGNPDRYGYAVFGKVVSGMDVVDAIAKVPTGSKGMHRDVPLTPVVVEKAEVLAEGE